MKLIINASNLLGSGGMQVANSFIHECRNYPIDEFHVFLSPKLNEELDRSAFPQNFFFYAVDHIPGLFGKGLAMVKLLREWESSICPDCVFTVFGPSYWKPTSIHVMGYAMPHYIYPESPFYKIISLREKLEWKLRSIVKMNQVKNNAQYYHVETEDVRRRLAKTINVGSERIYVVSNTHSALYDSLTTDNTSPKMISSQKNDEFRLICISAYWTHKNLEIINEVVPILLEKGCKNVKFVLTLPTDIFLKVFKPLVREYIINVGPVAVKDCPLLYSECDAAFLPTLLECFSANYPEAMKMKKPIITSELGFARTICGDAALYFDPLNPKEIADTIIKLMDDETLGEKLVLNGSKRLLSFDSATQRAKKYLNICKHLVAETPYV